MNFKKSPFAIQDKNSRDLDNVKDYPTLDDLMREQNTLSEEVITVHQRRDLDSLGWFYRFAKLCLNFLTKKKDSCEPRWWGLL